MDNGWNVGLTIQIISLALTICIIPLIKILLSREVKRFEEKIAENKAEISELKTANKAEISELKTAVNQKLDKLKDEMNDMKIDMPFIYVTREDFIRSMDNVDRAISSMGQTVNKVYEHLTRKGE